MYRTYYWRGLRVGFGVIRLDSIPDCEEIVAKKRAPAEESLHDFLKEKPAHAITLFNHFIKEFRKVGKIEILPAKTMIGIATPRKRIAYITQFGKNFIHVVFPFQDPHEDNLCFQKIARVPGDSRQFNHHFRMLLPEDINIEVKKFMKKAWDEGV